MPRQPLPPTNAQGRAREELITADRLPGLVLGAGTVPEQGRRQLRALDGIRGIAVLAVMLSHFERFLPATPFLVPIKVLITYGWVGVDLFFVLSGFLITGILLETKAAVNYFQSFYARRFLRIFPIYYATLFVIFTVIAIFPNIPRVPPADQRWLYFVYLCNWIPFWTHAWPPNVVGHFWTLAVEEQFYILWPLCVFVLSARGLFRLALGASVGALVIRCLWVWHAGATPALMLGTFTRMDTLLIGAIAAMMYQRAGGLRPPRNLNRIGVAALGATILITIDVTWHKSPDASFDFFGSIGYTLLAVGFAALVLGAALNDGARDRVQQFFTNALLRRTGRYSYGMYVYHVPILGIIQLLVWNHLPASLTESAVFSVLYVAVLTVTTFGVAAASYELFERRILALKRTIEPAFRRSSVGLSAGDPPVDA